MQDRYFIAHGVTRELANKITEDRKKSIELFRQYANSLGAEDFRVRGNHLCGLLWPTGKKQLPDGWKRMDPPHDAVLVPDKRQKKGRDTEEHLKTFAPLPDGETFSFALGFPTRVQDGVVHAVGFQFLNGLCFLRVPAVFDATPPDCLQVPQWVYRLFIEADQAKTPEEVFASAGLKAVELAAAVSDAVVA